MKAGLSQSVRLGQELKINPRLYQAMDMLYMPLLDLQQHLKQELLTNPFLEMVEEEDDEETTGETAEGEDEVTSEAAEEPPVAKAQEETDWETILLNGFEPEGGVRELHDDRERYEAVPVAAEGLDDHLRQQIQLLDLTPRQLLLADEFIGNINDEGYLSASLEEILEGINHVVTSAAEHEGLDGKPLPFFTMVEAEEMLGIIQRLDPPGIGARDLRECLLLQLREAGRTGSLADRLVREFFDELIAHRWSDVARKVGCAPAEVQHAADEVAKLNPKPGLAKSGRQDNYVVPDLVVEKIDGQYLVFINDSNVPRLKLSRTYQALARDKKRFEGESKEFISSKLNAAQWLIQAIEQRRQTMLKVMHYIVDRQRDFFDKGVKQLKPLTLREVADAIGMHESTVSRVTNEKYVQTPRGVLPLKFFFSSGLSTAGGEDVSARGIKATIEELVSDEDARAPLTDQAIVEILEKEGVHIARRTVAKYRDQLGVLSARMRKRV
ncbi:MAG TPA: RNA polymerase factor sigma-54 [Gemmatimonadaceae bacterium]|nr:RNA polymerase factor sigma-54 [Gemmatimonadaceae bacterium]